MRTIEVVAGIIKNSEGKILVARKKAEKSQGGKWEFPGGKIENETPEAALERELLEEIGIKTKTLSYFFTNEHIYPGIKIRLISYFSKYISGEFTFIDHDKIEWAKVSELKNYDFAEADIPIVKELKTFILNETQYI